MSIFSVNILSVCLSVMLQKALLLMDVFILVFFFLGVGFRPLPHNKDIESTLIWFRHGDDNGSWKTWVDRLEKFLEVSFLIRSWIYKLVSAATATAKPVLPIKHGSLEEKWQ